MQGMVDQPPNLKITLKLAIAESSKSSSLFLSVECCMMLTLKLVIKQAMDDSFAHKYFYYCC